MGNPCAVVITRGKNKGKTCGSINIRCKHVSERLVCVECNMTFDRTTSYSRHIHIHQAAYANDSKIKIAVKKKEETKNKQGQIDPNDVMVKLLQLERQNNELREEVEVLKQIPVTTTNYIAVLGTDFYGDLISKFGKSYAIKFLADCCVEGTPLSVFQKLYLDDKKPNDYPVACKDKLHFRYLDNDKRVVEDQGGTALGTAVSKKITDALLLASNDAMTREMENNTVYNMDRILVMQDRLTKLDKSSMIQDLAYITNNPNHPFFRDP
jgi:uncharacterized C2H2 Zn-finger protein